jgi:SAM-dependent methyltransferase
MDISKEALELAEGAVFSLTTPQLSATPVFAHMTDKEIEEMFHKDGDRMSVKPWIKEGITWQLGDAGDPKIVDILGPQDIVVANNFLCHMYPPDAERCLRNIAGLVRPGGYLFVSGMDIDIRTKVAEDQGWNPLQDLIEEAHEGDSYLRDDWPWEYWGLEPFNKRRRDWKVRYASGFRIGEKDLIGCEGS